MTIDEALDAADHYERNDVAERLGYHGMLVDPQKVSTPLTRAIAALRETRRRLNAQLGAADRIDASDATILAILEKRP